MDYREPVGWDKPAVRQADQVRMVGLAYGERRPTITSMFSIMVGRRSPTMLRMATGELVPPYLRRLHHEEPGHTAVGRRRSPRAQLDG